MNNKEKFIEEVEKFKSNLSDEAQEYFEAFKIGKKVSTGEMTQKGKTILKVMQDNCETYNNVFTAKGLGEILATSGRSVSGSIKKLITDGYVEKLGANPISYGLTAAGKEYILD